MFKKIFGNLLGEENNNSGQKAQPRPRQASASPASPGQPARRRDDPGAPASARTSAAPSNPPARRATDRKPPSAQDESPESASAQPVKAPVGSQQQEPSAQQTAPTPTVSLSPAPSIPMRKPTAPLTLDIEDSFRSTAALGSARREALKRLVPCYDKSTGQTTLASGEKLPSTNPKAAVHRLMDRFLLNEEIREAIKDDEAGQENSDNLSLGLDSLLASADDDIAKEWANAPLEQLYALFGVQKESIMILSRAHRLTRVAISDLAPRHSVSNRITAKVNAKRAGLPVLQESNIDAVDLSLKKISPPLHPLHIDGQEIGFTDRDTEAGAKGQSVARGFNGFVVFDYAKGVNGGKDHIAVAISDPDMRETIARQYPQYEISFAIAPPSVVERIFYRVYSSAEDFLKKEVEHLVTSGDQATNASVVTGWLVVLGCSIGASDIFIGHINDGGLVLKVKKDSVTRPIDFVPAKEGVMLMRNLLSVCGLPKETELAKPTDAKMDIDGLIKAAEQSRRHNLASALKQTSRQFNFRVSLIPENVAVTDEQKTDLGSGNTCFFTFVSRITSTDPDTPTLLDYRDNGWISPKDYEILSDIISSPEGLFLVSGPTGSGKSTTLNAMLAEVNPLTRSIQTIEKPVEKPSAHIFQYTANSSENESEAFQAVLKGLLRNAPDIIVAGEVRDAAVTAVAADASSTGHLVFGTIHTNSADASLDRLTSFGLSRQKLSLILRGIMAQRLIRKLCPHCKQPAPAEDRKIFDDACGAVGVSSQDLRQIGSELTLYRAKENGCPRCSNGYLGRSMVYEILPMTSAGRDLLLNPERTFQQIGKELMAPSQTMKGRALLLAAKGVTSVSEVKNSVGF